MSWKETIKEWGGGDVSFLSEDGECITFVVIGEPKLIQGKFKGQETERVGCPCIIADGFTLLIFGKRVARRLSKHEADFNKHAFDLIRHGEPGSTDCTYELKPCDREEINKELLAMAAKGVPVEEIDEAIEAAREIASG